MAVTQPCLSLEPFCCTESKMISKRVGDDVTLSCSNTSVIMLVWKLNGENLFSFKTENAVQSNNSKNRLDLKLLDTPSQLYALAIENAQKFHEGNYTCEMTTEKGMEYEFWELLIKGDTIPHITIHITHRNRKEQE